MRVLVLEGIVRECLAVVRSLGKYGVVIDIGDPSRINPARFSKFVSRSFVYPDPKEKPNEFFNWLINHVKENSYNMVFPLNDYTYEICTSHQSELGEYTSLAVNDWETFRLARDKEDTIKHAINYNVPVPLTWFPKSKEQLINLLPELPGYPLLLKPTHSSGSRGIKKVNNEEELIANFEILNEKYGKMLLQDYIPGSEILDVPMVFNMKSEIRGALVSNRIRMYPAEGGPNVAGHAVKNNVLREQAIKLMNSLGWKGVGLVEFKVDERDGIPKLMEINPRFWGSTQLGISAGIDWPWMLFESVTKGDCETKMDYCTNRLLRWLLPGEIMHFFTRKRRRELWPEFFRFFDSNTEYYVYRKDDIKPFLGLLLTMIVKIFDRKMIKYYIKRR